MNATSLLQVEGSTLPGKCGPGNPFRLAVVDEGNSEQCIGVYKSFPELGEKPKTYRRPFTTSICGLAQLTPASTPAAASFTLRTPGGPMPESSASCSALSNVEIEWVGGKL